MIHAVPVLIAGFGDGDPMKEQVHVERPGADVGHCRVTATGHVRDMSWIASHDQFLEGFREGQVARILFDLRNCLSHPSAVTFVDFLGRIKFRRLAGVRIALYGVRQREGFEKMDMITRISREAGLDFAILAFEAESEAQTWLEA